MAKYRSECRRVGAYDADQASLDSGFAVIGVSRTQQSHAEEADINTIVKRFKVTGIVPQGVRRPTYGDFDDVGDFRTAMDAIVSAERAFAQMPAEVRKQFGNDPALFVEFCSDDKNLEAMRKMGLAVPAKAEDPPMRVEVVNPPEVKKSPEVKS